MYRGPLLSELDDAVRRGSQEQRVKTLRRITDLFLGAKEKLSDEQIEVFDQVLCHLITRMEATALIELSERLAPINNAPTKAVHTLAVDDEIAIAGPVLSVSDRLTTLDLIEIAMAKGHDHLLAISKRRTLSESLTEVLVERGDTDVISALADNPGAQLSEKTYASLLEKPGTDETLLEKLGLRFDIPLHILRRVFERVSEAVRSRLLALAPAEKRDDIAEIMASISDDVVASEELDRDFGAAERLVTLMREKGELDEVALLGFAKERQYAAAITALATMCSAPVEMIKQMLEDGRLEPLLVPCKAGGISWPTLRALLQDDAFGRAASDDELAKFKGDYKKLSPVTAKKVLEFWSDQQTHAKASG
jgi:uncharacterized protein (DUF2336 family)